MSPATPPVPIPPRAVVFDFDGVILETNPVKTTAFAELFRDLPEHREAILRHHRENLGISRYRKFEWIYRELLGRELTADESRRLGERYSELVVDEVLASDPVPGALELLAALEQPLFVASGTPQEELRRIVERRGLAPRFVEVHGSPASKDAILLDILARHGWRPDEVLMVGDGSSDYRAAAIAGVPFVGRAEDDRFAGLGVPVVSDLTGLAALLGVGLPAAAPGADSSAG